MAKKREVLIKEDRPSLMEIQSSFYFKWFPRFSIHYRTDRIDFADPLIIWTITDMGIKLPDEVLELGLRKDISNSTIEDFLE